MCATVSDIQTAPRAIKNLSFRFHTFYSERFVAMETLTADIYYICLFMHPSPYLPLHLSFPPFFHFSVRLCLASNRPSNPPLLRPSFQPALYSLVQLSNLSSLPPSISPSILLTFPCSVLQYVGPSFRPFFRAPGDSLCGRDPPYLPRSVSPFFKTVG